MPLRALRLFPLLNSELNLATSSPFFTLQIPASRKWSRRAIHTKIFPKDANRTTCGKNSNKSGSSILTPGLSRMTGATSISCNTRRATKIDNFTASNEKATALRGKQKPRRVLIPQFEDTYITGTVIGCTEFDPVLNNYEPTDADLFFEKEPPIGDYLNNMSSRDLSSCLTTVNIEEHPHIGLSALSDLSIPTSYKGLYRNLIHILRAHTSRPSLPALIDYHQLFPDHQSTKTYNLLILLSLHHWAFGITYTLFRAMQDCSMPNNLETHRLRVRFLIYQGLWDKAWSYAMQLTRVFPGGSIPFPIWLEFCQMREGHKIKPESTSNPIKKTVRNVSEPKSVISARMNVMNTNRPLSIPALEDTPPAGIRNIVQMMTTSGMKLQALKLTEDYFRALPLELNGRVNHKCLDIVKIHLIVNGRGQSGVPRFNAAKTLLFSLMSLNPSLRPTPSTLVLILSTLKKVKRCGTVAWKFISLCKKKWGPEVEDRQVQRFVSKWALKEGRMDIVTTIWEAEAIERRSRQDQSVEREVVGDSRAKPLFRPPVRKIYPHIGRENYRWCCHRKQVRRGIFRHIARGRRFTKAKRLQGAD